MTENKRKYRMIGFMAGIFMLLLTVQSLEIYAAENAGSVTIEYHGRTKDDTVIHLSGAQFVLYEIGCFRSGTWTFSEAFQNAGISLDHENASDRKEQAEELYAYAVKQKLQGKTQKTDESGIAVFDNLEPGFYLIAQKEELVYGESEEFMTSAFLMSIPSEVDGKEAYHVTVEPKSEWEMPEKPQKPENPEKTEKPQKPSEPETNPPEKSMMSDVKTGDPMPVESLAITLLVSFGILCGLPVLRRKRIQS